MVLVQFTNLPSLIKNYYRMNKLRLFLTSVCSAACLWGTQAQNPDKAAHESMISGTQIDNVIRQMTDSLGTAQQFRIERGVRQTACLWTAKDGSAEEWERFCRTRFVSDPQALERLFSTLDSNFETLFGFFNRIDLKLKEPIHLVGPEVTTLDEEFGGYDVSAHFMDDMYGIKVAFLTALNFPHYTLQEKTELGEKWDMKQWGYARMGDLFTVSVPAAIKQNTSQTVTASDNYISNYNIYMGALRNDRGKQLFPADMVLISHWGLRDELKSNYGKVKNGLEKQRMVYDVMKRIIDQSIPTCVINSGEYTWNPKRNQLKKDGKEVTFKSEPDTRYLTLLKNFRAMRSEDRYHGNTYLQRAFESNMEIPQKDVKELFEKLVSSPEVRQTAALISKRLGRPLEPFDIWYNGFAPRPLPEEQLTAMTQKRYPDNKALKADLPNILVKLGWKPERAREIAHLISVDAARGSGHAWGAQMKNDQAHLRTRIQPAGMDYKGYNIAIHEFGHNVEQTITMNDVPYYVMNGVPNTAFTEAVAFLFQKRDLELLGMKDNDPEKKHLMALEAIWDCYEIMGVSLVDMQVWEWLYAHPECNETQLKEAVIGIAKKVWNKYYADVLGGKDQPLLAIYSHMIDNPLYLPNYPIGHLIDFQLEEQVRGKNIADELQRMYTNGRMVPQLWLRRSVGKPLDVEPVLSAVREALKKIR